MVSTKRAKWAWRRCFKITRDGETVPYLGIHYKRPAPIDQDYLVLKANQTRNFKVELSGVYDFSEVGFYSIDFDFENLALFSTQMLGRRHSAAPRMIADNVAEIYVEKVASRKGKPCNPKKKIVEAILVLTTTFPLQVLLQTQNKRLYFRHWMSFCE